MPQDASAPKRRPVDLPPCNLRSDQLARSVRRVLALQRDLTTLQELLSADLPEPDPQARINECRLVAVSALLRDTLCQILGADPLICDDHAAFSLATEQALIHRLVRRHGWTVTAPGVMERRPTGHA